LQLHEDISAGDFALALALHSNTSIRSLQIGGTTLELRNAEVVYALCFDLGKGVIE
jgi:hypothetical protein